MTKPTQKRKKEPFVTIQLKEQQYKNFKELYETNKGDIYQGVFDIYTELKNSRKRSLMLLVTSNMGSLEWETEFDFSKNEYEILMEQLIPYYEDIEDYEKCVEIKNLYEHYKNK
jgi:hypothetical protein